MYLEVCTEKLLGKHLKGVRQIFTANVRFSPVQIITVQVMPPFKLAYQLRLFLSLFKYLKSRVSVLFRSLGRGEGYNGEYPSLLR